MQKSVISSQKLNQNIEIEIYYIYFCMMLLELELHIVFQSKNKHFFKAAIFKGYVWFFGNILFNFPVREIIQTFKNFEVIYRGFKDTEYTVQYRSLWVPTYMTIRWIGFSLSDSELSF